MNKVLSAAESLFLTRKVKCGLYSLFLFSLGAKCRSQAVIGKTKDYCCFTSLAANHLSPLSTNNHRFPYLSPEEGINRY